MKLRLLMPLLFLPACASLVDSNKQHVMIETDPAMDSSCNISNAKGSLHLSDTPHSISVIRAYSPLIINCTSNDGAYKGSALTNSVVSPVAFGNVLVGGIIGAGVDMPTRRGLLVSGKNYCSYEHSGKLVNH